MPFTQVYQKSDCTAAKDISWANIAKRCKVEVPAMAINGVNRKVAKAPKFDVVVEFDSANDKGRVILKGVESKDVVIDFSTADPGYQKKVAAANKIIAGYSAAARAHAVENAKFKGRYKTVKDRLAKAEAAISGGKIKFMEMRKYNAELAAIEKEAKTLLDDANKADFDFDKWYLAGPRKGQALVLSTVGIDEQALKPADARLFDGALMGISGECNDARGIFHSDVKPKIDVLFDKLKVVRALLVKTGKGKLAEVEKILRDEIDKYSAAAGNLTAETKVETTLEMLSQMADPSSRVSQQMAMPRFWKTYYDSNEIRLTGIPKWRDFATKQAARIVKTVPGDMQGEGRIPTLLSELDRIRADMVDQFDDAEKLLKKAKGELLKVQPK